MSEDEEIAASVQRHGWHCINVAASSESAEFAYTIGLMTTWKHPEIIVFGLEAASSYAILEHAVEAIRSGESFRTGSVQTVKLGGFPVAFRGVHPSQIQIYLGYAMGHHRLLRVQGPLEALQLLWPDPTGRVPFMAGCDSNVCWLQPSLHLAVTPSELRAFRRMQSPVD